MSLKKKILVTGASGFIGQHILQALEDSFTIYTLSRSQENSTYNIACDIAEIDQLEISFDYIIHAAGNKKDPATMRHVNVKGTEAILRLAEKTKAKIIHIGSGGVYGIYSNPDQVITNRSAYHPQNEYEKTKAEADEAIVAWGKNHPDQYVILQPTNVIGEGDPSRKLLNLCHSLKNKQFFFLSRNAFVNYVYVKTICAVILEILKENKFPNQKYIVNSPLNIEEFISTLSKELKISAPTKQLPIFLKPLLFIFASISSKLPPRYQKFTLGKYYELTSPKYYQSNYPGKEENGGNIPNIHIGIHNLVAHYRNNNWL